jgi:serine/threonine protein kinase
MPAQPPTGSPDDDPPELVRAIDRYLDRLAAGEELDFDAAVLALPPGLRSRFRIRVLPAEFLWWTGEGQAERARRVLERCVDGDERRAVQAGLGDAGLAARALPSPLAPGDLVADRYELRRELGRGGIGVVFEAHDRKLDRPVAIKVVRVEPGRDLAAMKRSLLKESRTLASLEDEHVVTVHDVVEDDVRVCLVLSLVRGCSLEEVITRIGAVGRADAKLRLAALCGVVGAEQVSAGPLAEGGWYRAVACIAARLAAALEAAHGAGVLHGDIKPQNVMLQPSGEPVLLDFGLAQRLGDREGEGFQGTPEYLAPEQVESYRIGQDRRTDVYALGLVLYELLALRRAFPRGEGEGIKDLFARIVHRRFRALRVIDPGVPRVLDRIVTCAIAKDPDERYGSAGELAEDLERWLHRRPPRHAAVAWHLRARLFVRRVGLRAGVLVVLAAAVYFLARGSEPPFELRSFFTVRDGQAQPLNSALDLVRPGDPLGAYLVVRERGRLFALDIFTDGDGQSWVRPVRASINKAGYLEASSLNQRDSRVVLDSRVDGTFTRQGVLLLVCQENEQAVQGWLDDLHLLMARQGTPGVLRSVAERRFKDLSRGGGLSPEELAQVQWGALDPDGGQVATGILRYEMLFDVER